MNVGLSILLSGVRGLIDGPGPNILTLLTCRQPPHRRRLGTSVWWHSVTLFTNVLPISSEQKTALETALCHLKNSQIKHKKERGSSILFRYECVSCVASKRLSASDNYFLYTASHKWQLQSGAIHPTSIPPISPILRVVGHGKLFVSISVSN